MTRRCFTLIELLVVVAIVFILMSLLMPGIKNVRASAKRIECGNNLRQLGTAVSEYSVDYDSFYPLGLEQIGTDAFSWTQKVAPYCTPFKDFQEAYTYNLWTSAGAVYYLPKWRLFVCPDARTLWGDDNSGVGIFTGKYTANGDLMPWRTTSYSTGRNTRTGFMREPSATGMLWDGKYGEWEGPVAHYLASIQWNPAIWVGGTPDYRHLKTLNLLFADGHNSCAGQQLTLPIAYGANGSNDNLWR
jgi:prepilin-type processing-associated H-X9-DG protein